MNNMLPSLIIQADKTRMYLEQVARYRSTAGPDRHHPVLCLAFFIVTGYRRISMKAFVLRDLVHSLIRASVF